MSSELHIKKNHIKHSDSLMNITRC